jgi:xylose isomerase
VKIDELSFHSLPDTESKKLKYDIENLTFDRFLKKFGLMKHFKCALKTKPRAELVKYMQIWNKCGRL